VVLVFVDLLCSEFSQAISQNLRYSNFIFIYPIYLQLNNLYYFCVYDFRSIFPATGNVGRVVPGVVVWSLSIVLCNSRAFVT